jgi:hypothetical protein
LIFHGAFVSKSFLELSTNLFGIVLEVDSFWVSSLAFVLALAFLVVVLVDISTFGCVVFILGGFGLILL